MTAALMPGAAVFAFPHSAATSCAAWDSGMLPNVVLTSDLIVVAEVRDAGRQQVVLEPEVYLKGPAHAAAIPLRKADPDEARECPYAEFAPGQRLVAFVQEDQGSLTWPDALFVFDLEDGTATNQSPGLSPSVNEDDLIHDIRLITEQYAVPAANDSEGEGIEWATTVLPVAVALGIVFVIGLYLMRIWHRIDPS